MLAGARDSQAFAAVVLLVGAVVGAPVAAIGWRLDSGVWPFLAATCVLELGYFALLAFAYTRAELSVVYPLARGLAPPHARGSMTRRKSDEVSWFRSGSTLDDPLKKVVRRAGIPPISNHSFRRTWENLASDAGIEDLVRRTLAGWRTEKAQAIYARCRAGSMTLRPSRCSKSAAAMNTSAYTNAGPTLVAPEV